MSSESLNRAYVHAEGAERLHARIEEISAQASGGVADAMDAEAERKTCHYQFTRHVAMAGMWAQIAAVKP